MRWYPVIISTILLLQLPFGVLSEDPACQAIDESFLKDYISNNQILLDSVTQDFVDNLSKKTETGGKNAWHCKYPIVMLQNTEVHTLKLPKRVFGLQLLENPNLSSITLPEFVAGKAEIVGNNRLNGKKELKELERNFCSSPGSTNNFDKCDVKHDECWFDYLDPIKNADDLNTCSKMRSLVKLDSNTQGTITSKWTEMECIFMVGTQMENLEFLDSVTTADCPQSTIEGNEKLCISYTAAVKLKEKPALKQSIITKNYGSSCKNLECTFADYKASLYMATGACTIISDKSIAMDCKDRTEYMFKPGQLGKFKGTLTIKSCYSMETVERINYFTEIDGGNEVAVVIQNLTDKLEFLWDIKTTLKGEKILKVVNENQFSFADATRVRMRIAKSRDDFKKIEFSKEDEASDGECVVTKEMSVPDDCEVVLGDVFLDSNSSNVSSKMKEVKGCLRMDSASHLENYDFLKNLMVDAWEHCWSTDGKTEVKDTGCIPLKVRQSMSEDLLKVVTPLEKNNIQKCDCFYNESVPEIPESCTIIDGDLILSQYTRSIPSKIEEVTGCIKIFNGFDPDLSFLKYFTNFNQKCIYGNGVSGIYVECIPFGILPTIDQQKMKIQNNPAPPRIACGECNSGNVQDIDYSCKIIIGSVMVKGVGNGDVERKMENVEVIYGALIIEQNEADKIEFPALKRIEVGGGDARIALNITDNKNLVSIELPALESISVNGSSTGLRLIHIESNPNWNASESLQNKIKALTGSDCSEVKGSGCFLKKEPLKPMEKEKASERELRIELAMGMGITSAVLLTIGSPILALGLYWRRARQKMGTW